MSMNESSENKCEHCIQNGSEEFTNEKYWVMFSGGKDSTAVAYYLAEQDKLEGVVTFDTGVSVPGYLDWIKDITKRRKWKLHISSGERHYYKPNSKAKIRCYEDWIKVFGFPSPATHNWIMNLLKGRAFLAFKKFHGKESLVASGIRFKESARRNAAKKYNNKDVSYFEKYPIFMPIYDWSTEKVWQYVRKYDIEVSPAYKTLHISGDCLCGAFTAKDELYLIKIFYPEVAKRFEKLELMLKSDYPNVRKSRKDYGSRPGGFSQNTLEATSGVFCSECDINN